MSKKDYFTNKKAISGNTRSHALNHSKRKWNLNLQTIKIVLPNKQIKRVKVSAKTLKTLNKKKISNIKKFIFTKNKSIPKKEKLNNIPNSSKTI